MIYNSQWIETKTLTEKGGISNLPHKIFHLVWPLNEHMLYTYGFCFLVSLSCLNHLHCSLHMMTNPLHKLQHPASPLPNIGREKTLLTFWLPVKIPWKMSTRRCGWNSCSIPVFWEQLRQHTSSFAFWSFPSRSRTFSL